MFKILTLIIFASVLLQVFEPIINAAEPIIIDYADELIGAENNTRQLVGNVQLHQGNVLATCESAIQYLQLNKFLMSKNVVIRQKTLTLKAPSVIYNGNSYLAETENGVLIEDKKTTLAAEKGNFSTKTQVANFWENVVLHDDSVSIYCDAITHNRNSGDSKASGNTLIKGKFTNTFLIADSVLNFHATNYSLAYGNSVLYQVDTIENDENFSYKKQEENLLYTDILDKNIAAEETVNFDTLTIKSDTMEAFRGGGDEFYHFRGNVEIVRNGISAKCGDAYFYKARQYFVLRETPIIWYENMQLHSDSMTLFIPENKLERVHSVGNAISVTSNDTNNLLRKDQLFGNEIEILFSEDSLRKIVSTGEAKSIYFMQTEGEADGAIKNNAALITIEIVAGQAENIVLQEEISGEYSPEPLVSGLEKEFFLSGYKFSADKPARPKIVLKKYFR